MESIAEHPASHGSDPVLRAVEEVALSAASDEARLDDVLRTLTRHACDILNVRRSSVYLRVTDGRYQGRVGSDRVIDPRLRRQIAGAGIDQFTSQILQTRRPVQMHLGDGAMRDVRGAMRRWGAVDVLGIPLLVQDDVIGILYLDDQGTPHEYSAEEAHLAGRLGRVCAPAIRQTWVTDAARQRAMAAAQAHEWCHESDSVAGEVSQAAIDGWDVTRLLQLASSRLRKSIVLYHPTLQIHAQASPEATAAPPALHTRATQLPWLRSQLAHLETEPTVMIRATPDTRFRRIWTSLRRHDETLGYLEVCESPTPLRPADLEVLRKLRAPVAFAMQSAATPAPQDRQRLERPEMGSREYPVPPLVAAATSEHSRQQAHLLLAPLLAGREDSPELLETLTSFVTTNSSYTRTSRKLAVHVNTVRNRLERLKTLTGIDVNDTRQMASAVLALQLLDLIPHAGDLPGQ